MLQLDGVSIQACWDLLPSFDYVACGPPILGAHAGMSGAEHATSYAGLVEVEQKGGNVLTGSGEILLCSVGQQRLEHGGHDELTLTERSCNVEAAEECESIFCLIQTANKARGE